MPRRKRTAAENKDPPTKVAAEVYLHVMKEVIHIARTRDDFAWQSHGDDLEPVDEHVWSQLRQLWEEKLRATEKSIAEEGQVPGSNLPSVEEYEKLQPQSQRVTPVGVTDLPFLSHEVNPLTIYTQGSAPSRTVVAEPTVFPCVPLGPDDSVDGASGHRDVDTKPAMATPYNPYPGLWMENIPVNPTYEKLLDKEELGREKTQFTEDFPTIASRKRKQHDRETSSSSCSNGVPSLQGGTEGGREGYLQGSVETYSEPTLGRLAPPDEHSRTGILRGKGFLPGPSQFHTGVLQENYNYELGDDEPQRRVEEGPKVVKVEPAEGSSDSEQHAEDIDLNEFSNFDDLDFDDEEKACGDNLVMCLFERVTKKKGKWKCSLTNGLMCLNGKKYAFGKANGQVDFS